MKWIGPVFTNAGGWAAFVSLENGEWYIDRDNPIKIGEGKSGLMLLPIMQKGYGENYEHQISLLKIGLAANGMDTRDAYSFPFYVPVLFAFQNRMVGWSEIACDWVQHIQLNAQRVQILLEALQDESFSKRISIETSQTVLKIINSRQQFKS